MLSTELSGYSGASVEAQNAETGRVQTVLMSFPSRIRTTAESGLEAIFGFIPEKSLYTDCPSPENLT